MGDMENIGNMKLYKDSNERINAFLQDYTDNFIGLDWRIKMNSKEALSQMIKEGYRMPSVKEYIEEYKSKKKSTINTEDEKDPILIEKTKKLDELANRINSLSENITKEIMEEIMKEVKGIVFN